MVEKAIYERLIDPDNATALVALTSQRIYPVIAPQPATFPYVVYARESTDRKRLLSGSSHKLPAATIRIACWGAKYDDALNTGAAVITAVDDMYGSFVSSTIIVHKVQVIDEFDAPPEFETEGKEKPAYQRVIQILAWYRE